MTNDHERDLPEATERAHRHADHSTGQRLPAGLARDLAELAREMRAMPDMEALLERIAQSAVREVDRARWACISEVGKREIHIRAATDRTVERVDKMQMQAGDGPCLTSLREQVTVRCDDLATDARWPSFGPAAVEEGVRSMLSVQLFVHDDNLGALNLYSPDVSAFDEDDETIAVLLAAHAAVAMKGANVESNLRTAVASRDIIGQAKGILIERLRITGDEAFGLLVMASQQTHRKLRDVADDLVSTGDFRLD